MLPDNRTDVDGYGHKLRNNVSYKSRADLTRADAAKCDITNNSWDLGLKLTEHDFASLDEKELLQPRHPNGNLPAVRFMHPAPGSQLLGRGVTIGTPPPIPAADLGAFGR